MPTQDRLGPGKSFCLRLCSLGLFVFSEGVEKARGAAMQNAYKWVLGVHDSALLLAARPHILRPQTFIRHHEEDSISLLKGRCMYYVKLPRACKIRVRVVDSRSWALEFWAAAVPSSLYLLLHFP